MSYSDYMKQAIIDTIAELQDDKILQYIYTMVMSAIPAETLQEDS